MRRKISGFVAKIELIMTSNQNDPCSTAYIPSDGVKRVVVAYPSSSMTTAVSLQYL